MQRLGLVDAGELEQVLDEQAHADGLLLDALHGLGHVLRRRQRAHAVELGVAAHRHQGGTQLVAGVADETAHLVDGLGAVSERPIDAREHGVEGTVESADLGVGCRARDPLAEVAFGDGGGCRLDLTQRGERRGHEKPCEGGAEHHHREAEPEEDPGVVADRAVRLGEAQSHDESDGRAGVRVDAGDGDDAPLGAVIPVPEGERPWFRAAHVVGGHAGEHRRVVLLVVADHLALGVDDGDEVVVRPLRLAGRVEHADRHGRIGDLAVELSLQVVAQHRDRADPDDEEAEGHQEDGDARDLRAQ